MLTDPRIYSLPAEKAEDLSPDDIVRAASGVQPLRPPFIGPKLGQWSVERYVNAFDPSLGPLIVPVADTPAKLNADEYDEFLHEYEETVELTLSDAQWEAVTRYRGELTINRILTARFAERLVTFLAPKLQELCTPVVAGHEGEQRTVYFVQEEQWPGVTEYGPFDTIGEAHTKLLQVAAFGGVNPGVVGRVVRDAQTGPTTALASVKWVAPDPSTKVPVKVTLVDPKPSVPVARYLVAHVS